jgi:putative transposase
MKYDPQRHHRRSIRSKEYDYSQAGVYFVTICTKERECVLEDAVVTAIILDVWHALPGWFPTIELDEFVVMPNHIHLIVWLLSPDEVGASLADARVADALAADGDDGARASLAPTEWVIPRPEAVNLHPTLGDVIGTFKSLVFTVYLDWVEAHDPARRAKFWQRNYYEHVIRSEIELNAIRQYIINNPLKWEQDRDNPIRIRPTAEAVAAYLSEAGL